MPNTKRKPAKKPAKTKNRTVTKRKLSTTRRRRRSTKSTQVTGPEIDEALETQLEKTPLERKIGETINKEEQGSSKILVSTHYDEASPFDPDVDVDDEPENRKKMYDVPQKPRTPEKGGNSGQEEPEDTSTAASAAIEAYETYFKWIER